jgi:prepilin-type processing-associated H-X9-DG protein/prepilin-type N-terminal cleavage/methylation domain-containing protein
MRRHVSLSRAFTLVELLVVIAVIVVLVAVLLPVLAGAQQRAREVQCQSNLRQVAMALHNYAADNKGKFPPNINPMPPNVLPRWNHWCEPERIGRYLRIREHAWLDATRNPVFICPEDEGSVRSYAMNWFACSAVVPRSGQIGPPGHPRFGRAWNTKTAGASRLILLAEGISYYPAEWRHVTVAPTSYEAHPLIYSFNGVWDTPVPVPLPPGKLFVGDLRIISVGPTPFRYTARETNIDWSRHRPRGDGGTRVTEARGRANIAFGDGHVESFRPEDLADRRTFKSKFVAIWSPDDRTMERFARF